MSKNLRLKRSREYVGISQAELGERIGLKGRSYIAQLESGDKEISYKQIIKLSKALGINPEWLETGEGEQFATESNILKEPEVKSLRKIEVSNKGVPFYDIEVTGSLVRSFSDTTMQPEFFIDFPPFNDCTAWLPIVGDSMFPRFQAGEMVGIKQIFNMESILWGEPHLVITNEDHDNLRTVKTVHEHSDPEKIVLRASNPQFKGDTVIYKKNILSIYIIKGQAKKSQY